MIEFLYDLLISLPISVLFTGIYDLYFLSDEKKIPAYVLAVLLSFFISAFFRMKTKWKIVSGSAFLGIILILVFILKGEEEFVYLANYDWCLLVFALSALAYGVGKILTKYVRLKGGFSILVMVYLVFSMVMERKLSKADTIASGTIVLTALSELIQKYWNKEGYTDRKTHTVTIAPFFLTIFVIIAFVKTPGQPYDWQLFIDAGNAVKQGYIAVTQKVFKGDKEGYISVYGVFNDDGELHPDVSQSKNRVMALKPYGYAPSRIYLAGIVSDDFDGRTWTRKNIKDDEMFEVAAAESMYSAKMFGGNQWGDYLRTDGASLRFTYFNTQMTFLPDKTILFEPFDSDTTYKKKEGTLRFDDMQGYGTRYDFRYAIFNQGSPVFDEYVNGEHPESEESFNEFTESSYYESIKPIDYDDLLEYRDYVYDVYLPETEISEKAEELLSEITADSVTDYDKCKAIEEYLHGYEYTWHPGEYPKEATTPDGFLDYFLFENKQGYCAYYATAFVLMARAEGIPARYVQGYCVPTNNSKEVEVKGSMAHAWPEAYIKGVGWIQFEPTSGGNGTVTGMTPSYWATQEELNAEYEERSRRYYEMYAQGEMSGVGLSENATKEGMGIEENEDKHPTAWLYFLIPLLMAVVSLAMFTVVERVIMGKRFDAASTKEKIRIICKKNIQLLRVLGYKLGKNETLEEYQKRLSKDLPSDMLGFIMIYEKLLYSNDELSTEEEKLVRENCEAVFDKIKERRGQFIYFVQRSITNIR